MQDYEQLTNAIASLLPPDLQDQANILAQEILHAYQLAARGQRPTYIKRGYDFDLALSKLSGKKINTGNVNVSFGNNNQIGDITIKDIAGRDIINIIITNSKKENFSFRSLVLLFVMIALFSVAFFYLITRNTTSKISFGLPVGASIIEQIPISIDGQSNRLLVLWMSNPRKVQVFDALEDHIYTCPEQTTGNYYSGPTRISLVDTTTNSIINTINVTGPYKGLETDTFSIPYEIRGGLYYDIENPRNNPPVGKPVIMLLRDYTGDGRLLEFPLFMRRSCVGVETTLFGYSVRQDKVVQYPIELTVTGYNGEISRQSTYWLNNLTSLQEIISPGHWKYKMDTRGHGGTIEQYEVLFDAKKEIFIANVRY